MNLARFPLHPYQDTSPSRGAVPSGTGRATGRWGIEYEIHHGIT
ncbi:hypothetical protein ACFS5L_09730 [Streptomyces phyllanthi]|nr:hypothetical protein [Streptomyces phyllanthi]